MSDGQRPARTAILRCSAARRRRPEASAATERVCNRREQRPVGLLLRYSDASNWVAVLRRWNATPSGRSDFLSVVACIAGTSAHRGHRTQPIIPDDPRARTRQRGSGHRQCPLHQGVAQRASSGSRSTCRLSIPASGKFGDHRLLLERDRAHPHLDNFAAAGGDADHALFSGRKAEFRRTLPRSCARTRRRPTTAKRAATAAAGSRSRPRGLTGSRPALRCWTGRRPGDAAERHRHGRPQAPSGLYPGTSHRSDVLMAAVDGDRRPTKRPRDAPTSGVMAPGRNPHAMTST